MFFRGDFLITYADKKTLVKTNGTEFSIMVMRVRKNSILLSNGSMSSNEGETKCLFFTEIMTIKRGYLGL